MLDETPEDTTIVVVDNGGFLDATRYHKHFQLDLAPFPHPNPLLLERVSTVEIRNDIDKHAVKDGFRHVWVLDPFVNLGAGVARNIMLSYRRPGEPFLRLDDDWLPKEHGWLSEIKKMANANNAGLVRVGDPGHREGARSGPQLGRPRWRSPDTCGPIWYVGGECADALGGFFTGYGATLLDDLEYSRRAAEWQQKCTGRRAVLETGWPLRDLCTENKIGSTPWNPPWDLFKARARLIKQGKVPLFVPLRQPSPGYSWREAGRAYQELR